MPSMNVDQRPAGLRATDELIARVDAWAREHGVSRNAAMNYLLNRALRAESDEGARLAATR